jgi:hypothetical protein
MMHDVSSTRIMMTPIGLGNTFASGTGVTVTVRGLIPGQHNARYDTNLPFIPLLSNMLRWLSEYYLLHML